jgi:NAD-dependent SIR2 family protein deacetylase
MDNNSDCTICFEDFASNSQQAVVVLACGHLYHRDCITSWLNRTPTQVCPKCSSATIQPMIAVFHDWIPSSELATTQFQVHTLVVGDESSND